MDIMDILPQFTSLNWQLTDIGCYLNEYFYKKYSTLMFLFTLLFPPLKPKHRRDKKDWPFDQKTAKEAIFFLMTNQHVSYLLMQLLLIQSIH